MQTEEKRLDFHESPGFHPNTSFPDQGPVSNQVSILPNLPCYRPVAFEAQPPLFPSSPLHTYIGTLPTHLRSELGGGPYLDKLNPRPGCLNFPTGSGQFQTSDEEKIVPKPPTPIHPISYLTSPIVNTSTETSNQPCSVAAARKLQTPTQTMRPPISLPWRATSRHGRR